MNLEHETTQELIQKTDAAERLLAHDQAQHVAHSEMVIGAQNPNAPLSIRLSAPLVVALDRLAAQEHRKRSNLIQHILWEYVRTHQSAPVEADHVDGVVAQVIRARR